ncbi:hypothetical protein B0H13DRAFT_1943528 [Mycena leptocephala]|nr:hypothetical protein B0H13DRAFT_1943528 [Mycena leptocephala]
MSNRWRRFLRWNSEPTTSEPVNESPLVNDSFPPLGGRHHRLLYSNDPPSDCEIPHIREYIEDLKTETERRVSNINQELDQLQKRSQHLRDNFRSLSATVEQNIAVLSPARRIPKELVRHIFCFTIPPPESIQMFAYGLATCQLEVPWILGQICSHWRAVAIAYEQLWDLVPICFAPAVGPAASAHPLDAINEQLKRTHLFRLIFVGGSSRRDDEERIFRHLAQHSTRWKELHLHMPNVSSLLGFVDSEMPALRTVALYQHDRTQQSLISIFHDVSSLRDFRSNVPCVTFPTQALTHYGFRATQARHLQCLSLAANLVEADVDIIEDDDADEMAPRGITLPQLQRVSVSAACILRHLQAPSLLQLSVSLIQGPESTQCIHDFLGRSACSIQRFYWGAGDGTQGRRILKKKPYYFSPTCVESIMHHLTPPLSPTKRQLACQLRSIAIEVNDPEGVGFPWMAYACMLQSRIQYDRCRLQSSTLRYMGGDEPPPSFTEAIQVLRSSLDLVIELKTKCSGLWSRTLWEGLSIIMIRSSALSLAITEIATECLVK